MKLIKVTLLWLLTTGLCYAQTTELEKAYMSQRYERGDFNVEKYKEYGKAWAKLLQDFGGYPELPYDEQRRQVRYQTTLEVPNVDKKTIYKRLKEYAAINRGNVTEYLRYDDYETGRLIITGKVPVFFEQDIQGLFKVNEKANLADSYGVFIFTYTEQKLKVELTEIEYTFKYRYDTQVGLYNPLIKQSLSNLYPVVSSDELFWKQRLSLLKNTNDSFVLLTKGVETFVKDYKRDWNIR